MKKQFYMMDKESQLRTLNRFQLQKLQQMNVSQKVLGQILEIFNDPEIFSVSEQIANLQDHQGFERQVQEAIEEVNNEENAE